MLIKLKQNNNNINSKKRFQQNYVYLTHYSMLSSELGKKNKYLIPVIFVENSP